VDVRGDLKDSSLKKPHVKTPKQTNSQANNQTKNPHHNAQTLNPYKNSGNRWKPHSERSPCRATGSAILWLCMI